MFPVKLLQESAWTSPSQLQPSSLRRHRHQLSLPSSHKAMQVRLQLCRSRSKIYIFCLYILVEAAVVLFVWIKKTIRKLLSF